MNRITKKDRFKIYIQRIYKNRTFDTRLNRITNVDQLQIGTVMFKFEYISVTLSWYTLHVSLLVEWTFDELEVHSFRASITRPPPAWKFRVTSNIFATIGPSTSSRLFYGAFRRFEGRTNECNRQTHKTPEFVAGKREKEASKACE